MLPLFPRGPRSGGGGGAKEPREVKHRADGSDIGSGVVTVLWGPQKDTEKGRRGQGRRRCFLKEEQHLVKWRRAQWQGKSGNVNDYERDFR